MSLFLERFFVFFNKNYKFYRCIDISFDYLLRVLLFSYDDSHFYFIYLDFVQK